MNRFLKGIGITFRRDEETKRPRVNKLDSQLDRRQKAEGEYYYSVEGVERCRDGLYCSPGYI